MKLYLLRGCPFAHRASFVLREKKIAFDPIFFDLGKRPPELEAVSPYAKSPTLFDGEARVWDAQIVLEYIEDRFPEPAFLPKDAVGRAEVRMLEARVASELGAKLGALVGEALFKPPAQRDPAKIEDLKKAAIGAMAPWDVHLAGKNFLVGDSFSLADVTLYTLLPAFEHVTGEKIPSELANLRAWYDRLSARPASKLLAP